MKVCLSLVFLFSFYAAFPQAVISFDSEVHDFGAIKEIDGVASCKFEFINKGKSPILIKDVEPSCGCSSLEWTRQPVLPGKTGFIKTTFDPKDRPGYFDKTITVLSNANPKIVELKIKGIVQAKSRTALDDYPYELPSGLRLPFAELSLMKVTKNQTKSLPIGVFNNAGEQVNISFKDIPPHIQLSISPQQIPNKSKATINASYNTEKHGDYGFNRDFVTMLVNGKPYQLPVSVFVEEDFTGVELATAPMADAGEKYHNFGQIDAGQFVSHTFSVKNSGKSALKIHRIYTNDDRVVTEMDTKEIESGQTASLIVKTVKEAAAGKVSAVVSIISNSPLASELKIRFNGTIK